MSQRINHNQSFRKNDRKGKDSTFKNDLSVYSSKVFQWSEAAKTDDENKQLSITIPSKNSKYDDEKEFLIIDLLKKQMNELPYIYGINYPRQWSNNKR